jgi:hypothetical protein
MDSFKVKFSGLFIAFLLIFNSNTANHLTVAPSFIIEDDMMRVETGTTQTIGLTQIFSNNNIVISFEGCGNSTCIFDVNSLSPQAYTVILTLNDNSKISTEIEIE